MRLEKAKTSRGTCKHCDFLGLTKIPAGAFKLCIYGERYINGYTHSMCATCARTFLKESIELMKGMLETLEEEATFGEETAKSIRLGSGR
jgi:hypothetical protein